MRITHVMFISAALFSQAHVAAGQSGSSSLITELGSAHATIARDLQAAAEKMPAEHYSYRPAPDVRTFGQIVAHVAGGQFLYCSQGGGARLDPDTLKKLNAIRPFSNVETAAGAKSYEKEELVALLGESTSFCHSAYSATGTRDTKALGALIGNVAHDNEHYGNIVTYMRLKGLVSPSTERAKTAGAR